MDRNAGLCESVLKREGTIETPTDYVELVNKNLCPNITWVEMEQERFKCYSKWLRNKYADQRKDIYGQPFRFSDMSHFNFGIGERVDSNDGTVKTFRHPGVVWMRKTLDPLEEPVEVDFRQNQHTDLSTRTLKSLHSKPIKLSDNKCKALLSLTKYLSPHAKTYYQRAVGHQQA